jgi:transglutaminase-like putative cysteine protease
MKAFSTHLFLCLFFFFSTSNSANAQIKVSRTPSWVKIQTYDPKPKIDISEVSYGLLTLLSDEQVHAPRQEQYIRFVRKITDNVGIQEGSSISINYDPTYQSLSIHSIKVVREGKSINKLNINDFQTIRQESNAESYIYDGSLNAIANLSDVRKDDIIDISYTIKGFNPIHKGHIATSSLLNNYEPVGKINFTIISDKQLYYKILNSDEEPEIKSISGFTSYNWQATNTEKPLLEENMPFWYIPYKSIFVTDFKDWEQVVDWGLNIYKDETKLSQELRSKIDEIKTSHDAEGQRISSVLKFVQDEIRYLGLESGIGAYQPFSPNRVYEQRYGDCKDKSFLLVSMLKNMGIKAYPALVNSTYGEALHEFLPTPKAFDHVVVKVIDSLDNHFFYDPTQTNQFGRYNDIPFPNYAKALVIKEGVNALEKIETKNKDLVEVFDIFDLKKVGQAGELYSTTVYRDEEADIMRNYFKSNSLSTLSKNFKSYYDNYYDGVEILKDPIIRDDSIANKITVEEFYKINELWTPMIENKDNIGVEFVPLSLVEVLRIPTDKNRKTPYALYFPTHRKHKMTIKLPQSWNLTNDNFNINSKNFDFSFNSKLNGSNNILYLDFEYKNKNAFVNPSDFDEYYKDIKKIENSIAYYIYIPKSMAKFSNLDTNLVGSYVIKFVLWVFGILIAAGIVVFIVIRRNNKKSL